MKLFKRLRNKLVYRLFPSFDPRLMVKDNDNKAEEVDHVFFVNKDGSISLNHDSTVVKTAFNENIRKLQKLQADK